MERKGRLGGLGLAAVIAQSLAITGMSFDQFVDASNPHRHKNRTETPKERADRRADETIITSKNAHEFARYLKADEKRKRKAEKRLKEQK